jgi:glycosyltransferase involved in cell wall biosynthesis
MKLIAISSHGGNGGAELTFASFLQNRPAGVEARVVTIGDGPLVSTLTGRGETVEVATGYEGRPTLARTVRFTRMLRGLIRRERPDVVWAMGIKAAILAAPAGRLTRVPVVWHKVDFSYDGSLARPTAAAVKGVIGVSEAVLAGLGPLRRRRLGVVFPPVTLPDSARRDAGRAPHRVGMLGRLTSYKGIDRVIRAAALLRDEFPDLRLTIAGEGPGAPAGYRETLLGLAAELGLADAVELAGFAEPMDLLPTLDVLVNATHLDEQGFGLEGLSGAMLEASWVGVPVVATRGGGTAEGLADGVTGTLVESADPEPIAAAIAPYLRNRELNERTGEAGRTFARERCEPARASARLFELLGGAAR